MTKIKISKLSLLLGCLIAGFHFVKAQQCFTDVRKLVATNVVNAKCPPLKASEVKARLSLINMAHNERTQLFSIEKGTANGAVNYTASIGGSNPIYSGSSYSELINAIGTKNRPNRQDLYFDLLNFNSTEEANFKSTCEVKFASLDKDVRVNTINRVNASEQMQNDFFHKMEGVSDVRVGKIETIVINKRTYFSRVVSYIKESRRYFLEIYARTQVALRAFSEILSNRFLTLSSKPVSLADIVSDAKKEMMLKNKLSSKDFLIRFKDELSGNMIVSHFCSNKVALDG